MQTATELVLSSPRRWYQPGFARAVATFVRRKPLGGVGLALLVVFVIVAVLAPFISPHNPNIGITGARFVSPSHLYPMGTDRFGRDQLSRVLNGATIALQVGGLTVLLGVGAGTLIGVVSAYLGGRVDFVVQRIIEIFQSLPGIIFALAIVTALGRRLDNVVIALAVAAFPGIARVVRSNALAVRSMPYIDAARAIGCSDLRIVLRHVLPNVVAVVIVLATAGLGQAIVSEASLSFLGAGIRPPAPSWGTMINEASQYMVPYPYLLLFPALALSIVVYAFNIFGDALRDHLDPRLRRSR
jgi:peptide/nickel transport system permease protein